MISNQLVEITAEEYGIELDIRYAKEDNITGKPLYKRPVCFLHENAAQLLKESVRLAKRHELKIKIFDAFRPKEVQQAMWNHTPDPEFLSNPETGSCPHCRGVAIDLTLLDKNGVELDMGTGFDAFTPLSHHDNKEISEEAHRNRLMLLGIMIMSGWDSYKNEWWHYQLFNPRSYQIFTDKEAGTEML